MPEISKVCPECGADMTHLDPEGHSLTHWPDYLDPAKSSKEARRRQALTLKGGVTQAEFDKIHAVEV